MAPDLLAESALIEMSRIQREAIDKQMRRLLILLDAGEPEEEARRIVAEAMVETRKEAA